MYQRSVILGSIYPDCLSSDGFETGSADVTGSELVVAWAGVSELLVVDLLLAIFMSNLSASITTLPLASLLHLIDMSSWN